MLSERRGGGTPSRSVKRYFQGKIPWLTVTDLPPIGTAPPTIVVSREGITDEAIAVSSAKPIPKDSVVFATRVSIGKVAIAGCTLATNQDFRSLLPGLAHEPSYIAWFLSHIAQFNLPSNQGTTIKGITASKFDGIRVPLPPRAEQRRIVAKIEALQERSRRAREALAEVGPLLEQFRQSVLAAAFRGDLTADWRAAHPNVEPAGELLHRIRAERCRHWEQAELAKYEAKGQTPPQNWQDKYEAPKPVDNSTLPTLPDGWEWVRVQDLGEVRLGRQRAPQYHSGPNMRPYLRVMNVFEDRIATADIMEMDFSPEDFERYRLEPGDILLNEGQSRELVGRSAIYRGEIPGSCFTNTLIRFRPDAPIESDYPQIVFLGYLKTGRFQQLAALTVNIAHLGASRFANMAFPLPPLEEQAEIVRRARGAFNQITRLEERLHANFADLDQLDQSILAKAFRGELVPQDPSDEPASSLLARIREQRIQQAEAAKHKQKTATTQLGNKKSEESSRLTPQQLTLTEVLLTKD
jgi:type I restriction enzyme, S subunit